MSVDVGAAARNELALARGIGAEDPGPFALALVSALVELGCELIAAVDNVAITLDAHAGESGVSHLAELVRLVAGDQHGRGGVLGELASIGRALSPLVVRTDGP